MMSTHLLISPQVSYNARMIPHLYIHLPFCHEKCGYCDFATRTLEVDENQNQLFEDYFSALNLDLNSASNFFGAQTFESIYFGGGTPSVVPVKYLEDFFSTIRKQHVIAENAEITVECNPNSLTAEKIASYKSLGIKRISLGAQTLHEELFATLGRIHTIKQTINVLELLSSTMFPNWSVDLMFGLPHQTLEQLKTDVDKILAYAPTHISIYGLILEKQTAFGKKFQVNQFPLPSEDVEAAMYEFLLTELPKRGYNNYEISNFSQPSFESRHNQSYWQNKNYLGLGISAASLVDGQRFAHTQNLSKYLQKPTHNYPHLMERPLMKSERLSEKLFLMLRTREGLRETELDVWEHDQFVSHRANNLKKWLNSGHLRHDPKTATWTLTTQGKLLANEIMAGLV